MPARAGRVTAVVVTLAEITGGNRGAVLALRVAPGQERFVGSVRSALADAAEYPHARPWYRAAVDSNRAPSHPDGRTADRAAILATSCSLSVTAASPAEDL